jgi:cephalosporin hydroxylase
MISATTDYAELNAVLDQARNQPANELTAVDTAQLLGLQRRWTAALSARLDQAIEFAAGEPLTDAAAAAWRKLAEEYPTLRAVLDSYEHRNPALAEAMAYEFRILAMGAGLVDPYDRSEQPVRIGRGLRELIRSGRTALTAELVEVS